MLWSQKWISGAVKTMSQSDAKINSYITDSDLSLRDCAETPG